MKYIKLLSFFCFSILFSVAPLSSTWATHLRAGQITAVRISPTSLTYRFVLTVYRDDCDSCVVLSPTATLVFQGLGEIDVPLSETRDLNNGIEEGKYFGTFTFPSAGTFRVSYRERFRNGCIRNMTNPLETELFIESEIVVNPFLGQNSTPVLLALPVDNAGVGSTFLHNPAAFDPDGDSLSYSIVTPKKSFDAEVDNYRPLSEFLTSTGEQGGASFFGINPVTGTLTWDTPREPGCYNVAIRVTEWRKGSNGTYNYLGFVVRDMQIIVGTYTNRRPQLILPENKCIAVGDSLNEVIVAIDPENNPITITPTSQIFDSSFPPNIAVFSPNPPQAQTVPAQTRVRWKPTCAQIRERPYQVVVKAEDSPPQAGQSLVDIQVWEIQVVGPRPTGLTATPDNANDQILLNWDIYSCLDQADELIVWRKEGCSTGEPMNCDVGAPDGQGYIEIARLPANATSYIDEDVNIGLSYSYRISATFPAPERGESYASEEVCLALLVDVPIFTKVDIVETSTTTGKIDVEFLDPFQFDPPLPTGTPFFYKVYRSENLDGNASQVEVFTASSVLGDLNVFSFQDDNLNTQEKSYNYQIAFFTDNQNNFRDSSDKASTVRLSLEPSSNCIKVIWNYNIPWSNQFKIHDIARNLTGNPDIVADKIGEFTPIGIGFGEFNDASGIQQDVLYYYKTLTRGSYYNDAITTAYGASYETLANKSQFTEGSPSDVTKPCPPILEIAAKDCENFDFTQNPPFENVLTWINPFGENGTPNGNCGELNDGCEFEEDNISLYRIYFRANTTQSFSLLAEVNNKDIRTFTHDGLDSFAGCYAVTSVDLQGNESDFSNEVCIDNCLRFELPNVFSPNGDGIGDAFMAVNYSLRRLSEGGSPISPLPNPNSVELKFIEAVDFTVYNRWGKKVFYRNNDIRIRWNGNEDLSGTSEGAGSPLPAGIYFYEANVQFISINPETAKRTYKGWVQILR